ncbi:hypothetical protein C4J81_02105 [Deltaproteobacteria bacterium Smac51]|nr:hypothetical protein C4J81_02105 [Deltaproteobacteria bacterium Smac51]
MTEGLKKSALRVLAVLSVTAIVLTGGCAVTSSNARLNLPKGVSIGQINGPGGEELAKTLRSRTSGGADAVLSGQVSFREEVTSERETVPVTVKAGKARTVYKPDPFTSRLWKVDEIPTITEFQSFDFQRIKGEMVFDWSLTAPNIGVIDTGRAAVDLNRTFGGFMASEKVAPSTQNPDQLAKEARTLLAEEMTRALTLDLGREPSPSEIETADDEWSRRARTMAMRGDWEGAKAVWMEALELNPLFSPALYNLGLYYERHKKPEEARKYYQEAFVAEATDLHRAALTRLTETLMRAGRLP